MFDKRARSPHPPMPKSLLVAKLRGQNTTSDQPLAFLAQQQALGSPRIRKSPVFLTEGHDVAALPVGLGLRVYVGFRATQKQPAPSDQTLKAKPYMNQSKCTQARPVLDVFWQKAARLITELNFIRNALPCNWGLGSGFGFGVWGEVRSSGGWDAGGCWGGVRRGVIHQELLLRLATFALSTL